MRIPSYRILFVCLFLAGGAASGQGTPGSKDKSLQLSPDEQTILDLTNKEREKAGLSPLKLNAKLLKAARAHSANMAKQDRMEHTLDDKEFTDRIKEAGYVYSVAAENIAKGAVPAKVMQLWMESELHKANILSADVTEIGIGIARNEKGERYYTQVFAAPKWHHARDTLWITSPSTAGIVGGIVRYQWNVQGQGGCGNPGVGARNRPPLFFGAVGAVSPPLTKTPIVRHCGKGCQELFQLLPTPLPPASP